MSCSNLPPPRRQPWPMPLMPRLCRAPRWRPCGGSSAGSSCTRWICLCRPGGRPPPAAARGRDWIMMAGDGASGATEAGGQKAGRGRGRADAEAKQRTARGKGSDSHVTIAAGLAALRPVDAAGRLEALGDGGRRGVRSAVTAGGLLSAEIVNAHVAIRLGPGQSRADRECLCYPPTSSLPILSSPTSSSSSASPSPPLLLLFQPPTSCPRPP
eukprot:3453042-Pyramimonas_sp.AAC.1